MPAYDDNPQVTGSYVWITADGTADRRSRASQVAAHKRRYEAAHGVMLEKITTSYSETPGFLHRTAVRYRINRPVKVPRKRFRRSENPGLNSRQRRKLQLSSHWVTA